MKVRSSLILLIVGLLLVSPVAYAEEAALETAAAQPAENTAVLQQRGLDESEDESKEPKATKSEVEAVRDEIQVLRDQWQRSLDLGFPTTVVQSNRPLLISGTGQLRYTHNKLFLHDDPLPANTFNAVNIPFFAINFAGNLRKPG